MLEMHQGPFPTGVRLRPQGSCNYNAMKSANCDDQRATLEGLWLGRPVSKVLRKVAFVLVPSRSGRSGQNN